MRTPPGIIGLGLLFWGLQTGMLPLAIVMTIALEGSRILKIRWDFSENDFARVLDFCALFFVIGLTYTLMSEFDEIQFSQFIPVIFFPFMATQAYSSRNLISMNTFFWLLRRKGKPLNAPRGKGISFAYPYLGLCVMGASAANTQNMSFYYGLCLLTGWGLWKVRSRSVPSVIWAAAVIFIGILSVFGFRSLHEGQARLENELMRFFEDWQIRDYYRKENLTSIGLIGEMKLSNRIVMRLKVTQSKSPPDYLQEALYDHFRFQGRNAVWYSGRREFKSLTPNEYYSEWKLVESGSGRERVTIATHLPHGKGVLALPGGTVLIDQILAGSVERDACGVVRVEHAPIFVEFGALFDRRRDFVEPPGPEDLGIPANEKPALDKILTELNLEELDETSKLNRIGQFFSQNFKYSLWQRNRKTSFFKTETPLSEFLLTERKGHCEYFATATVLLLRHAGIPAKYVTGYAVQEFSSLTDEYLIRARHAHAWVKVFTQGAWRDMDTTPSSWVLEETNAAAGKLWSLQDLISFMRFQIDRLRAGSTVSDLQIHLIWSFGALAVILSIWRFFFRKAQNVDRADIKTGILEKAGFSPKGIDSEIYEVEQTLNHYGFVRGPGETLSAFVRRVEKAAPDFPVAPLHSLVNIHEAYRFDPKGIDPERRHQLARNARAWISQTRAGEKL
jgi:protein-glutamine gamma-glutamyltransferase